MIRLFNHYLPIRLLLLMLVEALVLFQSIVLGLGIRLYADPAPLPLQQAALFSAIMLAALAAVGAYQGLAERLRTTCQRIAVAYGLSLLAMSLVFLVFPALRVSQGAFVIASLFAMTGVVIARLLFFHVTDVGLPRRRVLVLGNGDEAEQVIRFLHEGGHARSVQYAGMYPVVSDRVDGDQRRRFNHEQLSRTVRDLRVSEIVIAAKERRGGVLPLRQLLDCKLRGIRVMDLVSFYERELGVLRLDQLRASWLIFGDGFDRGLLRDVVKRVFDVLVAGTLLLLVAPLLIAAALSLHVRWGLPVFVAEQRVGLGGRTFRMYRLRTKGASSARDPQETPSACAAMPSADAAPYPVSEDSERSVTTEVEGGLPRAPHELFGAFLRRTGLDELPQLWNVLLGEMSFVGPRPEHPSVVARRLEELPYYEVRHSVKPGLTGWTQIKYREHLPEAAAASERLQFDLYYVKNHSLFLDLLILVATVHMVLLGHRD